MADANNPGQFGNRQDTEEQASRGGQMSGNNQDQGTQQQDEDMDMEDAT